MFILTRVVRNRIKQSSKSVADCTRKNTTYLIIIVDDYVIALDFFNSIYLYIDSRCICSDLSGLWRV